MSKKEGDENRDEDLENEDSEAAEAEDTDSDSDAEDEEESKDDSEDESDEDESEDKSDDEDEEEDDSEEEGKSKKGKFVMPDKFKGKSAEEIAEAYKNLEGMIGDKALEMAQNFLAKKGIKAKPEDGEKKEGEDDEDFDIGLSDEEIAKMSPKEFARHLNRKITEKATEIARNAIERSNEVKTNVSREIKDATKAHPHLKENKEYREIVLSIIEAANAKGKIVTLKEACEKADKAMNIKPSEKKDDAGADGKKKKPKTAVEKQDGSDGKPVKTDEDRVKEGMMNAGQSTGFLGGLGV